MYHLDGSLRQDPLGRSPCEGTRRRMRHRYDPAPFGKEKDQTYRGADRVWLQLVVNVPENGQSGSDRCEQSGQACTNAVGMYRICSRIADLTSQLPGGADQRTEIGGYS